MPKTLAEVLAIPGYELFAPQDIVDYGHLQTLIVGKFYDREIAYETVDKFRMKLNFYLTLHGPEYNKMLMSERIDFDPFMTDYHEDTTNRGTGTKDTYSETGQAISDTMRSDIRNTGTKQLDTRNMINKTSSQSGKNTVEGDARLYSSAENQAHDRNYTDNMDDITHTTKDTTQHKEEKWTETRDQKDTTDDIKHSDTDRDIDRTINSNQTERNWTENGKSKGHSLNVNSDTPQAMLFNTPNHYMGTGTAGEYGIANGSEYTPYLEDDLTTLESESRTINGGDTPWFNYASNAGNQNSKDEYHRDGTETYKRNQTEHDDDTTAFDENATRTFVGNYNASGTRDTDTTQHENQWGTETQKKDGTENRLDSTAFNSADHGQGYSSERGAATGEATTDNTDTLRRSQRDRLSSSTAESNSSARAYNKEGTLTEEIKTVRSGRTSKSPSALLLEYRKTLTYSADTYILNELEACFMQVF